VCHTQEAWHSTRLSHPFTLTGKHASTSCFKCHRGEPAMFHGTSNACDDCHHAEYERAPDHVGHFPITCQECHGFAAWKPLIIAWESEPPPPPPPPTVPTTTETTPPPPPPPTVKKPKPPKPKPTVSASATAVPTVDVVTHPSGHHHE
jgi:hypothetical protein